MILKKDLHIITFDKTFTNHQLFQDEYRSFANIFNNLKDNLDAVRGFMGLILKYTRFMKESDFKIERPSFTTAIKDEYILQFHYFLTKKLLYSINDSVEYTTVIENFHSWILGTKYKTLNRCDSLDYLIFYIKSNKERYPTAKVDGVKFRGDINIKYILTDVVIDQRK